MKQKGATGCVGDLLGMKNYPIMWGLFHKPLFLDPYRTTRIQWKVRGVFCVFWIPVLLTQSAGSWEEWGPKDCVGSWSFQRFQAFLIGRSKFGQDQTDAIYISYKR